MEIILYLCIVIQARKKAGSGGPMKIVAPTQKLFKYTQKLWQQKRLHWGLISDRTRTTRTRPPTASTTLRWTCRRRSRCAVSHST